jgi:SAM-dependent methyltransferase
MPDMSIPDNKQSSDRLYSDNASLSTRISTHEKYGSNPVAFPSWVVSTIPWKGHEVVLDIGCGPGIYRDPVTARLRTGTYTGIDKSRQMVELARTQSTLAKKANFFVNDAHRLSFEDCAYDVVLANHVLYHLDVTVALGEIIRVLRKNGILLAATNSEHSMQEIDCLHRSILGAGVATPSVFQSFSLESGKKALAPFFPVIQVHVYEDILVFTDPMQVVDYYASGWVFRTAQGGHNFTLSGEEVVRRCNVVFEAAAKAIAKDKVFRVHKRSGVFVGRSADD